MPVYEYNLGSVSNLNTATWKTLTLCEGDGETGRPSIADQILRFLICCATGGGTGVLGVALVDTSDGVTDTVIALYKATITATSDQTGSALATQNFICTTTFTYPGDLTDKLDVMGHGNTITVRGTSSDTVRNGKIKVKIGLYSATSTGTVTCRVVQTRVT